MVLQQIHDLVFVTSSDGYVFIFDRDGNCGVQIF